MHRSSLHALPSFPAWGAGLVGPRALKAGPVVQYVKATRHPWPCLLFVLPLLAVYEIGVHCVSTSPDLLRNGADVWLRLGLRGLGLGQSAALPIAFLCVLLFWTWMRWADRPQVGANMLLGMLLESLIYAFGLWAISRVFGPMLDYLGIVVSVPASTSPAVGQVLTYIGAGIYEEVLFRLFLYSAMFGLLRLVLMSGTVALPIALVGSALLFAAAHHIGPHGERLDGFVFLFRTVAGLYFTLVYQTRGFGIAVGTHAGYDILVGVSLG